MKHLTILAPSGEGNNLSSIVGAYKILTRANNYWKSTGREQVFEIQVAGISEQVEYFDGLFSVRPNKHIKEIEKTDLIIIPSLNHNYVQSVERNGEMVKWISDQYSRGAEVASFCTGAFLLASSGLLDRKTCSTHWSAADNLRQRFPEIQVKPDKLITDEQGIYTNGGAFSFLNLVIYLVSKYFDRQTAIYCSKVFQVDMERSSQSEFMIFAGQKKHADQTVREAQEYIENNLDEKITIDELSSKFSVGRRNFDRRFIKATGNTPLEYSQRVKVEFAKRAFESSRKTILEVMDEVGYSDVKAFREVFRKITGLTPLEYKSKYTTLNY